MQSLKLNGKLCNKSWLRYEDISRGGTLEFVMGPKPSDWAKNGKLPPSLSTRGFDDRNE